MEINCLDDKKRVEISFTRAEEQLYVIGCFDGDADEVASKDFTELKSNMERIICALHGKRSKCFTVEWLMADALPSPEDLKLNELLCDNDGETVSWNDYGYSCYCGVPAKVAVSELHIGLFESDEYERSISRSAKPFILTLDTVGGICFWANMRSVAAPPPEIPAHNFIVSETNLRKTIDSTVICIQDKFRIFVSDI